MAHSELPRTVGHPFYQRLNQVLEERGFDRFVEEQCERFYSEVLGRPSLVPGRYFRLLLIGYFEGIEGERGIAWRAADSLALRHFLELELKEEHEKFPKEFKSQLSASFRCSLEQNHQGGHEPAAICRPCYDHLQERVDLVEAALHMDLKEAAQIVYDAVWSDPSDPRKTYQNAAQALLSELCERSGITDSREYAYDR